MLPRASQEPSKRPQDRSKSPLGTSWPLLGHSEASKKTINFSKVHQQLPKCVFIRPLELLLGALLALLGVNRPFLGPHGRSLDALGALLGRSWTALGQFLGDLWQSLALSARSQRDPSKRSEQPNRTNTQLGSGGFASASSISIDVISKKYAL